MALKGGLRMCMAKSSRRFWLERDAYRQLPTFVPLCAFLDLGFFVALILSFGFLGLPPTPEEIQKFEHDPAPDAYEGLVERLLESPHYGERWARHWLDVVRFAETHGFEMNQPRPNAWLYRDYVIQAFNGDKP